MTDKPWKEEERKAAAIFRGSRYSANQGGHFDFFGAVGEQEVLGQVKHRKTLSLQELTTLAENTETFARVQGALGVVVAKYRAGQGRKTKRLIVMTETVWRQFVAKEEDNGTQRETEEGTEAARAGNNVPAEE